MVERLMHAYPLIYLACHRRHVLDDESGRRLTAQQANLLAHLDCRSGRTVSDLAAHMQVTEGTMSIHLKRLLTAGFITRESDLGDRRMVRVRLSARGAQVKKQSSVLDPELAAQLMSLVPTPKRESALDGLEVLGHAAQMLVRRRQGQRRRNAR